MNIHPVLERIFELSGEKFAWFRNGVELEIIDGLRNKDRLTEKQYIAVYPHLEIQRGDMLKSLETGTEYWIYLYDFEIAEGEKFQGQAFHVSAEEWDIIRQQIEEEISTESRPSLEDYIGYLQALTRIQAPEAGQEFDILFSILEKTLGQTGIEWGILKDFVSLFDANPWLEEAVSNIIMKWLKK
ncbi:MAG: hypothetical protein GXY34_08680 [Syntrophomonadaceae bacterium]|nr:hypothetical protein [Syntrophomonadaceae bacterium]